MNKNLNPHSHYHNVAIILHWVMAISFVFMIASGLLMVNAPIRMDIKFDLYQWHKAMGVLMLLAAILRVLWRLLVKPPPLPEQFSPLEQKAAFGGHLSLYILMFFIPLSGWLMVSASVFGLPTIIFGLFEWPHIPWVQGNAGFYANAKLAHMIMAYLFIAMIILHIMAVIKHAVFDGENLLPRIWFSKNKYHKKAPINWRFFGYKSLFLLFSFVFVLNTINNANATSYEIDYQQSKIEFSGSHAGKPFSGRFEDWHATIIFDPEQPQKSDVHVVFNTRSAKTGNAMYDGTLPQTDWFNVAAFPEAVFTAEKIEKNTAEGNSFEMIGRLQIRDKEQQIRFPFIFQPSENQEAVRVKAEFTINRLDFGIGEKSDAKAEWVSRDITMTLDLYARKAAE